MSIPSNSARISSPERLGLGDDGRASLHSPRGELVDVHEPRAAGGFDLVYPGRPREPLPAFLEPRPDAPELQCEPEPELELLLGQVPAAPERAVEPDGLEHRLGVLRGVAGDILAEVALEEIELILGVGSLDVPKHPQGQGRTYAYKPHAVGVEEAGLQEARVVG